tara:strand:- start:355 stop:3315 length:2961 start_codon:yes stop_codon:yes gene_type:complete
MASVTQRIQSYVGGVSKQPDDKKFPGQVREALNSYPDPTFGLQKRPGTKFLTALKDGSGSAITGTTLDAAKWFYIHRNNDEKYIGCIIGASGSPYGEVHVWNAATYVKSTITYSGSSRDYLTAVTKNDYHILTVQDTSIITNKQKTVTTQADPSHTAKLNATVRLHGIEYSSPYTIKIKVGSNTEQVFNRPTYASDSFGSTTTTDPKLNAAHILGNTSAIDSTTGLKGLIEAKISAGGDGFDGNMSVSITASTLEIVHNTSFTVTVEAGTDGRRLTCFQDEVNNIGDLPDESINGRKVKIVNTANPNDTYYSTFVATNGVSGPGFWEEALGFGMSPGLTASTMPHELVNTGTNAFTFRPITWTARLVGDDSTNSHPSFKDSKIQQAFFYNNRLGFLTQDNVSMSQSGEFYNFYHISAQTVSAADPVDLSCSSIRPAVLHGIIPVASGLILFSENQQFIMYSADGNLSPTTALIRGLSNYEMDTNIDPVDVGTVVNFISKTPAYTKIFGMTPRGEGQMPLVRDVGKVVAEYVPQTVDTLIASPQNSFIAMFGSTDSKVYFYRTHSDGDKEVLQAWFNWDLPGNVLDLVVDSDVLYTVIKQSNGYQLLSANLSATPEDEILVTQSGIQLNPYMDMYSKASSVSHLPIESITVTAGGSGYSSPPTVTITAINGGTSATGTAVLTSNAVSSVTITNPGKDYLHGATISFSGGGGSNAAATAAVYNGSRCYLPYADIAALEPIIVIAGGVGDADSGFTQAPDRGSDGVGAYFAVDNKNFKAIATKVIVGFRYNYDITLPKTYFQLDQGVADYTATLTIARMKFSVGRSSTIGFKLRSDGYKGSTQTFTGDGSNTIFSPDFTVQDRDNIKVKKNGEIQTTGFTITDHATLPDRITVTFNSAPAAASSSANVTTAADSIEIYIDNWYDIQPVQEANQYLADDVPMTDQNVYTVPIHQRTDNFLLRVFSDSPFPVALTSMMWEGNYSPRFYRRT